MSDYVSVRDNIVFRPANNDTLYQRVFVVSAYAGMTDALLEHKKSAKHGVFGLFCNNAESQDWISALDMVRDRIYSINQDLFGETTLLKQANEFIDERLDDAKNCLMDLHSLCTHGHFTIDAHLNTVREMLASIGEAHSAWNTAALLKRDGVNACFVDLTGWKTDKHISLDHRIQQAFSELDLNSQLPVVTGYAHTDKGLMSSFDRGYSEMTFSRLAVITNASEAVIHKEFHLSSADPRLVGENKAVPIGRTNYDVADQLSNLGMEAIHPKAAKGLRQKKIPVRVKNTFEPEHSGTLITGDYISDTPCVEIIAGCKGVYAIEFFYQDMVGNSQRYDSELISIFEKFSAHTVSKDMNANTITYYVSVEKNLADKICGLLRSNYPEADINCNKVAIVSAIGSDMKISGILARALNAVASKNISVLALHQSMRQVDMQFVVSEDDYSEAVRCLHKSLVEVHGHEVAICLAS